MMLDLNSEIIIQHLVSSYRKEAYTVNYILQKGFIRSELTWDGFGIYLVNTTMYGDKDYIVTVKNLRCSPPIWNCESPWFQISGEIPLHATSAGKLSWGFQCNEGNDDYKSQYWGETQRLLISVNIGKGQNMYCAWEGTEHSIDGRPESTTLISLIKEVIARKAFQ